MSSESLPEEEHQRRQHPGTQPVKPEAATDTRGRADHDGAQPKPPTPGSYAAQMEVVLSH